MITSTSRRASNRFESPNPAEAMPDAPSVNTSPATPVGPPQRSPRRALLLITGVAVILAALFGVYKLTLGRAPFAGETHHDFGYVQLTEPPSPVRHVFQLNNRTGSTIRIEDVRPSCGCTATDINSREIAPGGTLELTASLTLTRTGHKSSRISIMTADRGVQTLTLEGIGRSAQRLRASQAYIPLAERRPSRITIFAEVWPDDPLDPDAVPEPTLTAPEGVSAELLNWSLRRFANAHQGEPATWSGMVEVTPNGDVLADGAALVIALGEESLAIPLNPPGAEVPRADPFRRPASSDASMPDDPSPSPLMLPRGAAPGSPPGSVPDGR